MRRNASTSRALSLALLSLATLTPSFPTASRAAGIRISEVLVNPDGTDNGKTFVEIAGTPGESLSGYTIVAIDGGTGTIYLTADLSAWAIPLDGIFVAADAASGVTSVANADALFENLDPQNGPDSLQLRIGSTVIDAVGYGDFTSAIFAGEGGAAPLPPSGQSLARPFADVDTDDNAADFALGSPTPGAAAFSTPSPVPEPASLLLLGAGLASLGIARRRRVPAPCPGRVPEAAVRAA